MYCDKCNGFGFYTTIVNGKLTGRKCDKKVDNDFILRQDIFSNTSKVRMHNAIVASED